MLRNNQLVCRRWGMVSYLRNCIGVFDGCALLTIAIGMPGFAQVATGNISGYVKDPSGAVVADATVTAKMVEQQAVRTTKTDAQGFYSLLAMPPGQYEITFELAGFRTQNQTGLQLTVGQNLRVDSTLQVGNVQSEVTVGAQAPL